VKRSVGDATAAQRIGALAERWALSSEAAARLLALLRITSEDRRAPTTVSDPVEAAWVHVADSLSGLPFLDSRIPGPVADVGSGAGFPGLPLAIARPSMEFDLIEAGRRKCAYLEDVAGRLGLENVRVVAGRVEEWATHEGRERCTAVLVRAVAPLPTLVEYAAPLLRPAGVLIAWKGARDPEEEHRAAAAAEVLGLAPLAVQRSEPYPGSREHHLHLYEKVRATPARFPRRAGVALKRPLG
jgi:16S rRNA (guanine527-N7)-methyltransferase